MLVDHAFLFPLGLSRITQVRVSLSRDNDVTSRSGRKRKPRRRSVTVSDIRAQPMYSRSQDNSRWRGSKVSHRGKLRGFVAQTSGLCGRLAYAAAPNAALSTRTRFVPKALCSLPTVSDIRAQ